MWILVSLYVIAIMSCTLWIRVLPLLNLGTGDVFALVDPTDSLFVLRQIEQVAENFPAYAFYDPMTYYPYGQVLGPSPVFALIGAALCLIAGAGTRAEIVHVALLVPPLLSVVMIPVIFLLLRNISDLKTGLVGAGLIAVAGGNYFYYSLAGHIDHHIADVLFSTMFCLSYLYTLSFAARHENALKQPATAGRFVALSFVSGITFSLGILTTPAMIFFGLLIVLFTVVAAVYDYFHNRDSEYLLVLNLVTFGCAAGTFLVTGIPAPGLNLYEYSAGQPLAYLLAMIGTVVLSMLFRAFRRNGNIVCPAIVAGTGILGLLAVLLLLPELSESLLSGSRIFFGFNPNARLVQETQNWSLTYGWRSFGFGLVLAAGGYGITLWRSTKKYQPLLVFILVWSSVVALATWRQVRHEYYLAVIIVILSSLCIVWVCERGWTALNAVREERLHGDKPGLPSSGTGKPVVNKRVIPYMHIALGVLVVFMTCFFVVASVQAEFRTASEAGNGINPVWREAMEWLRTTTPDTGVDYYRIYDHATFTYPEQSYGILTWWDNGNMITFFARRIPGANPFQSGVGEAAAFFMAGSEETADTIADTGGVRYIVTDIRATSVYLGSIAGAYNSSEGLVPYKEPFLIPVPGSPEHKTVTFYKKPFFTLMLVRLHTFDGSMLLPGRVIDIGYTPPTVSTRGLKVITSMKSVDAADRSNAMAPGTVQAGRWTRNDTVSISYLLPVETVPALQHYRLVYESPGNLGTSTDKYIKIFEYVPGAGIPGEGIIELSLVTNGGRHFVYRQASIDGMFTVPYSTSGNPYNVTATGKYRIAGSGTEFDVSEDAVQKGLNIGM
jgi:dolichyl-diphosphooligosaccharide--protein glycosyltransferase